MQCCAGRFIGDYTIAPLQRVRHATARLVNCLRPRDHVMSALRKLHWLPIFQRIEYKLCLLVHKSIVGQAPDCRCRCSIAVSASRSYEEELCRTEDSLSVATLQAWTRLPTDLKSLHSTPAFKRSLKTFFFRTAYND